MPINLCEIGRTRGGGWNTLLVQIKLLWFHRGMPKELSKSRKKSWEKLNVDCPSPRLRRGQPFFLQSSSPPREKRSPIKELPQITTWDVTKVTFFCPHYTPAPPLSKRESVTDTWEIQGIITHSPELISILLGKLRVPSLLLVSYGITHTGPEEPVFLFLA